MHLNFNYFPFYHELMLQTFFCYNLTKLLYKAVNAFKVSHSANNYPLKAFQNYHVLKLNSLTIIFMCMFALKLMHFNKVQRIPSHFTYVLK